MEDISLATVVHAKTAKKHSNKAAYYGYGAASVAAAAGLAYFLVKRQNNKSSEYNQALLNSDEEFVQV